MGFVFRIRLLLTWAILALMAGARADASTLVLPDDSSLRARAELIVIGRVLATEAVERGGKIWTESAIAVDERIKGSSPDVVTVLAPGGALVNRRSVVYGAPELVAGERVLLFLTQTARGAYGALDLAAGAFSERTDGEGARFWFRDLRRSGLRILTTSDAAPSVDLQRQADSFERALRSGALDERAYLASFAEDGGEGIVSADFALPNQPGIQRWFLFDEGKSAGWVAVGDQDGYSAGGHPELAAAISAWTSCPGAKINYFFAGQSEGRPAGTRVTNHVNEVFFNDPLDEIPGAWNGRDGIVAIGGFDAALAPGGWTRPAGPGQAAESQGSWMILEGDIVVQDGVGPSRGIDSATLAEILAHELGHTLGFAHSGDPRALMYATLQNLGPFLRDDDREAARFLYPGPEAPATDSLDAPSNLQVASVSSERVRLTWSDNASTEVFQTIYYRPAGGAFAKFRDVGANVTVANVSGLPAGGTFEFEITARRPTEESPASNLVSATIPRVALSASFTVAPPVGTAGITTFSFYDQSKGAIVSREWRFGDGGISFGTNPTRVYAKPGTWDVTLIVRDDRGAEAVATRSVTVSAPPPLVADFGWGPAAIAGQPLRFADRSSGAPMAWRWEFGDGTTSSDRDPLKTFAASGRYEIALRIESGLQSSTVSKVLDVAAPQSDSISAEFAIAPDVATPGQPVAFAANETEIASSWRWDFGDGGLSSEPRPTYVYEMPGTYLVTLEVRRGEATATSRRLLLVQEGAPTSPVEDQAAPRRIE